MKDEPEQKPSPRRGGKVEPNPREEPSHAGTGTLSSFILHPSSFPARSVAARLFAEPFGFDFFQAVRLLEQIYPDRVPVGRAGPVSAEVARFQALASLSFPPSALTTLTTPTADGTPPQMTVTFMGLTGPSGVLPRHYTEMLLNIGKEVKTSERFVLRDWLDLFNHRLISLFFRAHEKYRFDVSYARPRRSGAESDLFTLALLSLAGAGMAPLQDRLRVVSVGSAAAEPERVLARVETLTLAYYSGLLSRRPPTAVGLQALVHDYLSLPVKVRQFQGRWLRLESAKQTRLGEPSGYAALGVSAVVGDRVWDAQGKIRLRIGPLDRRQFLDLLPDRQPFPERKSYFALTHLVRYYLGMELEFDVQLVLRADEVPECQLPEGTADGPQLGWTSWIPSQSFADDSEEAVFEGEDAVRIDGE